jgi:hypothetical protein
MTVATRKLLNEGTAPALPGGEVPRPYFDLSARGRWGQSGLFSDSRRT